MERGLDGIRVAIGTALVAMFVILCASLTLAGFENSPCIYFPCQVPSAHLHYIRMQCAGQVVLFSFIPIFAALVLAPESRVRSGLHLHLFGVLGAAVSILVGVRHVPYVPAPAASYLLVAPLGFSLAASAILTGEIVYRRFRGGPSNKPMHLAAASGRR